MIAPALRDAIGRRHGMFAPPVTVPRTAADPQGIVHISVADESVGGLASAGGGVGRTTEIAYAAAVGESLERYAAAYADLDVTAEPMHDEVLSWQSWATLHDGSPSSARYHEGPWTTVWSLIDNRPASAPAALVGLGGVHHQPSTSSGLAAHHSVMQALLRAAQELIERDALMGTFLHGLPGRHIGRVDRFDAFDLTQAWSPHPVVAVCGDRPLAGRTRWSLGSACRARRDDAIERAYLECEQGIVFVGTMLTYRPELNGLSAEQVTSFDHHAVYYSARPDQLPTLPLLQGLPDAAADQYDDASVGAIPGYSPGADGTDPASAADELGGLVEHLAQAGVELWYRELTTGDLATVGMRAVRVISEQLTPIHHDHRHRATGGTTVDRQWRWPDLEPLVTYPSRYPHPLG